MSSTIDINCDMGEGMHNEAFLMPYISSCNIACGAHAGDLSTIDQVIGLAKKENVKIGAHPSYPDLKNFGRVVLTISGDILQESLERQILLVQERAKLQEVKLHHVKLHGALYNEVVANEKVAKIVCKAIHNTVKDIAIYAPHKSVFAQMIGSTGYTVVSEVFSDRNYNEDLTLVSRKLPNAMLHTKEEVLKHVLTILQNQKVLTISGNYLPIQAETFCIHGDHKNAVEIAKHIYNELKKRNIEIA